MIAIILAFLFSLGLAEPVDPPPESIASTIPRGGAMTCIPCASWCMFEVHHAP